ncbi:MAG: YwiC-like family protein, partial [Chloroflexi bacterium]|nr:YwiC-like family protein [Chloroflexota bacterium]
MTEKRTDLDHDGSVTGGRLATRPRRRIVIPREHGAWAMLLVPFVIGTAVGPGFGWQSLLFLISMLAFFAARYPLTLLVKRTRANGRAERRGELLAWMLAYGGVGLVAGAPLVFYYGRILLVPLAIVFALLVLVQLYLGTRRLDRTAQGELFAIAGLSLAAPAAYYAGGLPLDANAAWLWLLSFLYSASSVFYVKMKVRHRATATISWPLRRRLEIGRGSAIYQALLVTVVVCLAILGYLPALAPLAFLPLTAKVMDGILRPRPR